MNLGNRNDNSLFTLEFYRENVQIEDLLKCLNISPKDVGLITVNKKIIMDKKTKLKNDDHVKIFPIVSGG
jgi:sulfur carrier protein ThiS